LSGDVFAEQVRQTAASLTLTTGGNRHWQNTIGQRGRPPSRFVGSAAWTAAPPVFQAAFLEMKGGLTSAVIFDWAAASLEVSRAGGQRPDLQRRRVANPTIGHAGRTAASTSPVLDHQAARPSCRGGDAQSDNGGRAAANENRIRGRVRPRGRSCWRGNQHVVGRKRPSRTAGQRRARAGTSIPTAGTLARYGFSADLTTSSSPAGGAGDLGTIGDGAPLSSPGLRHRQGQPHRKCYFSGLDQTIWTGWGPGGGAPIASGTTIAREGFQNVNDWRQAVATLASSGGAVHVSAFDSASLYCLRRPRVSLRRTGVCDAGRTIAAGGSQTILVRPAPGVDALVRGGHRERVSGA